MNRLVSLPGDSSRLFPSFYLLSTLFSFLFSFFKFSCTLELRFSPRVIVILISKLYPYSPCINPCASYGLLQVWATFLVIWEMKSICIGWGNKHELSCHVKRKSSYRGRVCGLFLGVAEEECVVFSWATFLGQLYLHLEVLPAKKTLKSKDYSTEGNDSHIYLLREYTFF